MKEKPIYKKTYKPSTQETPEERLLAAIIEKAVYDFIHIPKTHKDFMSAKRFLEEGCYGMLEPDAYMSYLWDRRENYWRYKDEK